MMTSGCIGGTKCITVGASLDGAMAKRAPLPSLRIPLFLPLSRSLLPAVVILSGAN